MGTDNKGAYDLCHRTTVRPNSRHVERKVFRMRELNHEGKVRVTLVPTADNYSDLLTKALPTDVFHKHRSSIFNLAAWPREEYRVDAAHADPHPLMRFGSGGV